MRRCVFLAASRCAWDAPLVERLTQPAQPEARFLLRKTGEWPPIASDANLVSSKVVGDPTEGALLVLAHKAGLLK